METLVPSTSRLEALGFASAAGLMVQQKAAVPAELRRKLRTAFEHFRYVEPVKVEEYIARLKKKTYKRYVVKHRQGYRMEVQQWMMAVFTPIRLYETVPPEHVLNSLEAAQKLDCFDNFEILHLKINEVHTQLPDPPKVVDPVLFGRIDASKLRYFIDQWGDDVSIEDILKDGEG